MSYRETRNLIEKLVALGYPQKQQPVRMDSFNKPNFPLVTVILTWLVKTYDPNAQIASTDILTEQNRVLFIRSVVSLLASQAQLKINPKKLYSADRYAVHELLKIANFIANAQLTVLDSSTTTGGTLSGGIEDEAIPYTLVESTSHMSILKSCKDSAVRITKRSPPLYDLLEKEIELRELRNDTISRQLEMSKIEESVKQQISQIEADTNAYNENIQNLHTDHNNLSAKLSAKQQELERREKRLKSLQGVRPAFMDEYEAIEERVQELYKVFVDRMRNLMYLENRYDDIEEKERERLRDKQAAMKKLLAQMQNEEISMLRNDKVAKKEETQKLLDELSQNINLSRKAGAPAAKQSKVVGSMLDDVDLSDEDFDEDDLAELAPPVASSAERSYSKMPGHNLILDEDDPSSNIYDF